jgi:hypothetical protein
VSGTGAVKVVAGKKTKTVIIKILETMLFVFISFILDPPFCCVVKRIKTPAGPLKLIFSLLVPPFLWLIRMLF